MQIRIFVNVIVRVDIYFIQLYINVFIFIVIFIIFIYHHVIILLLLLYNSKIYICENIMQNLEKIFLYYGIIL